MSFVDHLVRRTMAALSGIVTRTLIGTPYVPTTPSEHHGQNEGLTQDEYGYWYITDARGTRQIEAPTVTRIGSFDADGKPKP